jgi:hypothetical protein
VTVLELMLAIVAVGVFLWILDYRLTMIANELLEIRAVLLRAQGLRVSVTDPGDEGE